tara:strand:+ start:2064 stop:2264 length:201 start_codon:yes stop_codon:yes gene_type:complete
MTKTQELIGKARNLMESFDDNTSAMTIGFDKAEYKLTAEQMELISGALYLADCELHKDDEESLFYL